MLALGIVLSIVGLGFFCRLLFTLAIYALPTSAGLAAGLAAFHSEAGVTGAITVGLLVGSATLAFGQFAFAGAHAAHPRDLRPALWRSSCNRRLSGIICLGGHRHGRQCLADGIRRGRRGCLRLYGLLAIGVIDLVAGPTGRGEGFFAC